MRAVDLHHLAQAVSSPARLMQPLLAFTARRPDSSLRHPLAERLLADRELMPFDQLLAGKRWTEVDVVFADQLKHEVANRLPSAQAAGEATSRCMTLMLRPTLACLERQILFSLCKGFKFSKNEIFIRLFR